MKGYVFRRLDNRDARHVEYLRVIRGECNGDPAGLFASRLGGHTPFAVQGVRLPKDRSPDDYCFTWITDLDGDEVPYVENYVWSFNDEVPDGILRVLSRGWAGHNLLVEPYSEQARAWYEKNKGGG